MKSNRRKHMGHGVIRTSIYQPVPGDRVTVMLERHGHVCAMCDRALTYRSTTIDHVIPVSKGGRRTVDNEVPMCAPCNESKRDKLPPEAFVQRRRRSFAILYAMARGGEWPSAQALHERYRMLDSGMGWLPCQYHYEWWLEEIGL